MSVCFADVYIHSILDYLLVFEYLTDMEVFDGEANVTLYSEPA